VAHKEAAKAYLLPSTALAAVVGFVDGSFTIFSLLDMDNLVGCAELCNLCTHSNDQLE
jgi:hypothetical protein